MVMAMAKSYALSRNKAICIGAFLTFCALSIYTQSPSFSSFLSKPKIAENNNIIDQTFYDDPKMYYTVDRPTTDWDQKRRHWLRHNPDNNNKKDGVMVVTGSQPSPCKSPTGDHFLLRLFKNKVDYCRRHRYEIFYNDAFMEPEMRSFWAKIPALKAAMLAHPGTEWLFWVDSDAVFTDMDFSVPLERYEDHNMVVHGWPDMIYEKKSWVGLNAGVFLIRNCQWSIDFMDVWAGMGPKSPDYDRWGEVLKSTLSDKLYPGSDDQSALVYLLLKGDRKWRNKIYVENQYCLHGYWLNLVRKFDEIAEKYLDLEKKVKVLRRRHAEATSESYAAAREKYMEEGQGDWRRPFVTHFTGCQPCSGDHNPAYEGGSCWLGIERALNFADNQVLRNYGFVHPDLVNGSHVMPLPFDYPSEE